VKTSREAEIIVEKATEYAVKLGHEFITSEHILLALLEDKNFNYVLNQYGIDVTNFTNEVKEYVLGIAVVKGKIIQPKKTAAVDRIFNRAFTSTMFSGRERVTIWDIFISLSHENNTHSSYFILKYGIEREDFVNFIRQYFTNEMMNEQQKSYYENILEEYCTNLNTLVEEGKIDTVVGRKKEINEILQTFARRNKSNVLMVGDPGVGKTAIAEGLAKRIVEQDVPSYLKDYTVYNLEVGVILAGTQYRGQFEERIQEILEALIHKEKTILFIDEAHTMKGAGNGSNGGTDMANMLKPMLSKGKIKVIANTTWEEYTESFEKDRALMRRFYKIAINEPSATVAKEILTSSAQYFEEFHGALITTEAIEAAVDLSIRYQTDKKLPDKAFDLIDSACALKRRQDKQPGFSIHKQDIIFELSKFTGIPIDQLDEKKQTNILDVEGKIKQQVYGQDESVEKIMESFYVARAGLGPKNKPLGTYIFIGPTGTGKTELAKQLTKNLGYSLLRYDMSEYQEKHTVARFVGAPPGYVGYEDSTLGGGLLIRDIERNPNSVILFDEIEKAHPDVSNILLQLMDEGYITGSNGKRVDARNCIIVLTTNLGAEMAERNAIGFGNLERTGDAENAFKEFFRPEFRNRITAVCKFNKLDNLSKRKVVTKFINELADQLKERNYSIHVDEPSIDKLIEIGYDDKFGARPLERTINKFIRIPVSKQLLVDKSSTGCRIKVRLDNNEFIIKFLKTDSSNVSTNANTEVRVPI